MFILFLDFYTKENNPVEHLFSLYVIMYHSEGVQRESYSLIQFCQKASTKAP